MKGVEIAVLVLLLVVMGIFVTLQILFGPGVDKKELTDKGFTKPAFLNIPGVKSPHHANKGTSPDLEKQCSYWRGIAGPDATTCPYCGAPLIISGGPE